MTDKTPACQLVACADCVLKEPPDLLGWSPEQRKQYILDFGTWAGKLARYVSQNVKSDDDQLVTPEFCFDAGLQDSSGLNSVQRFEICKGVRVVFLMADRVDENIEPTWNNAELWTGTGKVDKVLNLTKGQLRSLVKILKGK